MGLIDDLVLWELGVQGRLWNKAAAAASQRNTIWATGSDDTPQQGQQM